VLVVPRPPAGTSALIGSGILGGYSPADLRSAYNVPEKGGAGQTIAIIGAYDYPTAAEDLATYRSYYGLPLCTVSSGCFRKVNETGGTTYPPPNPDWALEASLDLQMASALCPECKLLLIEPTNNSLEHQKIGANLAARLGATVASHSYGSPETSSAYLAFNNHYNHAGMPTFASSGDSGYRSRSAGLDAPLFPASSYAVSAVGGTTLETAANARGWGESVWGGSGGGCSSIQPKPPWQVDSGCAGHMSNDLAAVGDPETPVSVYNSYSGGGWTLLGGTSVSSPIVAGIAAHASPYTRSLGGSAFYKSVSTNYDVLSGTNYPGGTCSPSYLCNAGIGYDGPSGVGTPNGVPNVEPSSAGNWGVMPTPNTADAHVTRFLGISCTATTDCMAVGDAQENNWDEVAVARGWDGSSWKTLPALTPGSNTVLSGVSCSDTVECLSVGEYRDSAGKVVPLAELRDNNVWLVQSTPVPAGAKSARLLSVSCTPSPALETTRCTAVGNYVDSGSNWRPLAMMWNGSSWSLTSPQTKTGATSLRGVSCPTAEWCMAVGSYSNSVGGGSSSLAEIRNSSSWSIVPSPNVAGAIETSFVAVSCLSAVNCMAVGFSRSSGGNLALAARWDGASWSLQSVPQPPTAVTSQLTGVSCTSASACVASGQFGTGGANGAMAVRWDGTSWAQQEITVNPGIGDGELFSVACVAANSCVAAGKYKDAQGVPVSFAQHLFPPAAFKPTLEMKSASNMAPTSVTLNGAVNPKGSETTYQFEYGTTTGYGSKAPASPKSIGSGASPVEVSEKIEGLQPETTYHFRLVATNAQGTTEGGDQTFTTPRWKFLSTPNPSGASDSNLYDVSCEPSTSVCTAVGKSTASGVDSPVVQRWSSASWSEQTAAKKSGATHTRLFGVDCPSETRCLAVGNHQSSEGPSVLSELWNEGKWNVQTTPLPSESTSSEFVAVGCNSTANCTAVGSAVIGGVKKAIAERWTSPTWALSSITIPEGAKSSQLDGVDCLWSNFCVAVGRYTTDGGSIKSLVMFWNGTEWSLQTVTDPGGAAESYLLDASCTPTPNRCMAVGVWKNGAGEKFALAYRFNGTSTWTLQSTPNPPGSTASNFQDVSCATETSCTAVGSGGSTKTLAEAWNGTSWSIQGTPTPSGATFSSLFGVSCRSTTCMGVGWSTDSSGVDTTLAEIRE
jgi:hypothetical protein